MDEIEALRNDLERLVKERSIPLSSLEELKEELESEDMKEYLDAIVSRAKPEESLRQNFFYKNAPILRVLGLKGAPEVNIGPGFIDLIVRDSLGRKILIEFKRLFELRKDKLVRNELDYREYEDQIKKYIFSEAARFVVLTNLYEWHFFSSKTVIKKFKPFYSVNFEDLMSDLEKYGDFYSLLERKEHLIERKELDAKFFESLKEWIKLLSEIEFKVDEKEKNRLILHLLNKLIFIQTLDDYGVIEFNWLYKTWEQYSRYIALAEAHKDNPKVAGRHYKTFLQKFLSEINDFFYPLYDTELFRDDLIEKVKDEPENWKTFYERLAVVLGFREWQKALGLGLTQYDYSQIDEDILGKAYETYLAEQRKEKGIYYTPKYITQFIVEETLKKRLDELKDEIVKAIKRGDFEKAEEIIRELFDIRIIDLASGSGSFLIKALRTLWEAYRDIIDAIESGKIKASSIEAFLKRSAPKRLRELLPKDERILMSQIVLRHIFANDLDANALEVAKMNIWRELIRLNPKAFHWAKLGDNEHVLPNLSLNFRAGDSLLGFDNPEVVSEFKEEIKELWKLWEEFLKNPEELTPLERIEEIKAKIREVLDERYKQVLAEKGLNAKKLAERRFIHYPLEFFMVFFNKDGSVGGGFDFIIGNPPYVRIQNLKKENPEYVEFLNKFYESTIGEYDLALPFIERAYHVLRTRGELGFIVTKMWTKLDYGEKLRQILANQKAVRLIVDFGHNQVFDTPILTGSSSGKPPTTYTMILILQKSPTSEFTYVRVWGLHKTIEQLRAVRNPESARQHEIWVGKFPISVLSSDPWVLLTDKEERIVDAIYRHSQILGDIAHIFQGLRTSDDKVYIVKLLQDLGHYYKVYSKALNREVTLEKDLLKPVLRGRGIKKWLIPETDELILFPYEIQIINGERKARLIKSEKLKEEYPKTWEYLMANKERLENRERGRMKGKFDWYGYIYPKNLEKFECPKLLTPDVQNAPTFALDAEGKYYFTGGYGIILKDEYREKISMKYLVGLLNSSLLDWRLKQISKERRGGYYSYEGKFIRNLPIKLPQTPELVEEIETTTEEIIELLKKHYEIKSLWQKWSEKLSDKKLTLKTLIDQWKRGIGVIPPENLFITNVEFKSDEETEFDEFDAVVEGRTLKILGREADAFYMIAEIEASSEEIAEHLYFSLLSLLESRRKVKTLGDLLSKTEIPTIRGSPKETIRIVNAVKSSANVKHLTSSIKMAKENEAYLDALVFKLYGLTREEARLVLRELKAPENYISSVVKYIP